MSQQLENSEELFAFFNAQQDQIKSLGTSLNDCIKKRTDKSYINWLALSYGQASFWKKLMFFMSYVTLCMTWIYLAGLSSLFILPFLCVYWSIIFFVSNHYQACQKLNTQTLEILESILKDSIETMRVLENQFHHLVSACSALNDTQEREHAVFNQQLQRIKASNERYHAVLHEVIPKIDKLSHSEKTAHEKSQLLISMFEKTQSIMLEGQNTLDRLLMPKVNQTITMLESTQAQFIALKANFQKNLSTMNSFIEKLESTMHRKEAKIDLLDQQLKAQSAKTQLICTQADAINSKVTEVLAQTNDFMMPCSEAVRSTKNNYVFFEKR